jgi:ribosomal protein L11 methyltransferase
VLVAVPAGWGELVAEELSHPPCTTVVFGAPSLGTTPAPEGSEYLRTFAPAHEDTVRWREAVERRLAALAERSGCEELEGLAPRFRPVPREDWANSWRKVWRPFRVGRLAVVAPDTDDRLRTGDVRLALEPGGVFGTGRHGTTRACLRLLQERGVDGARVLDAGSGTGILAVAAALLGARKASGFDVDPLSRRYAEELAERNGVLERTAFRVGSFELVEGEPDLFGGAFDVVVANIYSDVLQEFSGALAARLSPTGWFAFSGCPDRHADATRAAIEAAGLRVEELRRAGRWCTFTGRRAT